MKYGAGSWDGNLTAVQIMKHSFYCEYLLAAAMKQDPVAPSTIRLVQS